MHSVPPRPRRRARARAYRRGGAGGHRGGRAPRGRIVQPPPATPTVDRRLVVHAHNVPITGTLAGGTLRGSLYPGFPGRNTLQITVPGPAPTVHAPGTPLDLSAAMPGMRMAPVMVRLRWRDGAYRGVIALPMFGNYTAQLTLRSGASPRQGTALLSLPLTLGD